MPVRLEGRLARPDRSAPGDYCSIDRAMQVVGTRSAMLLLREAVYGTTRFDDFSSRVGISDAVASARLRELVDAGLLERRPYREPGQRTRHEYALTDAGHALMPVVLGLLEWGAAWAGTGGGPEVTHSGCGEPVRVAVRCAAGHDVAEDEVVVAGRAARR